MAIQVTQLLTNISLCDASDANWSGGAYQTDVYKQGTGAYGASVSNTTSSVYYYTISPAINVSSSHVYVWMLCSSRVDTKANGGLRVYMYSTNGAWRTWYVGGNDTYPGGWQCFVVDPNDTVNVGEQSGTFDPTQVSRVGVQFKTLQSIKAGLINCFWDALRYGSGLRITSASTDTITLDNIFTVDDTTSNAYGIISKVNGVFYIQGELIFGSTTAGQHISFSETNQLVVFKSNPVATGLYKIEVQGNSTGTTKFQLGTKSGTAGIQGCVIKSAGTGSNEKYSFTATNTNISELKVYGSTFLDASTISLPAGATNREVLNCNFDAGAEILPDTCTMESCNVTSADTRGLRISSTSHSVTSTSFISCPRAINIPTAGTYTFNNLKFSGNTYDIENSSNGGDVVVNATSGSNPVTSTNTGTPAGTTTINNTVTLEVNGVKTGVEPTYYVRCRIEADSGGSMTKGETIMNKEAQTSYGTDGYYKAVHQINYGGNQPVIVRARYNGYLPYEAKGTITSGGLTVTAIWQIDPNFTA